MIARQFAFDLLDAGQAALQFGRQRFHQLVFRHTQRLGLVAQCVFGHHLVFTFAEQKADGRAVLRVLDLGIHRREVETQLTEVLGLEFPGLQLDHHIAP